MRPAESDLHALYVGERLTTRAIAERFGVRHITVRRWLAAAGIDRRPPGRGLDNRGEVAPDRATLHRLVHDEHRSYMEIGHFYGVDGAAVGHWLGTHGIARPTIWGTRRKGPAPVLPTEDDLRDLYAAGQSLVEIADRYGVSSGSIRRLCATFGIPVRDGGFAGGKRLVCADGHLVRSTYEQRVDDWLSRHGVEHAYEPVTPFDRRCHADFLANGWYVEIWGIQNSASYRRRRERKTRLYREHGLPLIAIAVHAFGLTRNRLWERRLKACLTTPPARR